MTTKDGKLIISCVKHDNVVKYGTCALCGYLRTWVNCNSLQEGDESFCGCPIIKTKDIV